jgi:hypothetical protein
MHRKRLALLAAVAVAAAIAPNASAATQRYASPIGSGQDCTAAHPCKLKDAVEAAAIGDDVIVNPGDYQLTEPIWNTEKTTIHGVHGQPRPRLLFSGPSQRGMRMDWGGSLRDVEIVQTGQDSALFAGLGASIDQVIARASGTGEPTATIQNATISNSILVASGTTSNALATGGSSGQVTSAARNVTAIATGSGAVPIVASASMMASTTLHLVNVIAYGGPNSVSLRAQTDLSGAQATITASHTNYQTFDQVGIAKPLVNGGGNRAEEPAFVNPAAGDYRQAPGAYTIDAGLDYGGFDVDGDPRKIGTTDIGADEFVPAPTATTGPAGAVTGQSATVSGSVTPKGVPTSYHFEYGTTTAYGRTTSPTGAGAGTGAVAVSALVGGLSAGTTYHYRIVASNAGGVATGADRTFTTIAPPVASQPPTTSPAPPAEPFAGVGLVSRRLTYARRSLRPRLSCPATTVGRCSGRTKLTAQRRASSRRVTLGRARFSIAAGTRARVRVRVSRAGRRLLNRTPRLRGRAVNVARDGAGRSRTTRAAVTIRHRRR